MKWVPSATLSYGVPKYNFRIRILHGRKNNIHLIICGTYSISFISNLCMASLHTHIYIYIYIYTEKYQKKQTLFTTMTHIIATGAKRVNSLWLNGAYGVVDFDQVMVCRLFGTKPVPQQKMTCCHSDLKAKSNGIEESIFKIGICKTASILCRPHCINSLPCHSRGHARNGFHHLLLIICQVA